MKIKVATLKGEKLAEWVAMAQGWELFEDHVHGWVWFDDADAIIEYADEYRPDINGGQAMELAKKFGLVVYFAINSAADGRGGKLYRNNATETAICHAVVALVYGEYVDDAL